MKIGEPLAPARGRRAGGTASRPAAASAAAVDGGRGIADSVSVLGIPEIELTERVRAAIQALLAELDALRRELAGTRGRMAELERLADQDTLVPVPNRRGFVREMHRVFSFARRYGVSASLLYFDLNGFKEINDRLGHAAGDAALLKVGRALVDHVRESDIVGRIGGDEFAVILLQADQAIAEVKAAALAAAIEEEPLLWAGEAVTLSLAYGVSALDTIDPTEALAAADRAMYSQKRRLKAGR